MNCVIYSVFCMICMGIFLIGRVKKCFVKKQRSSRASRVNEDRETSRRRFGRRPDTEPDSEPKQYGWFGNKCRQPLVTVEPDGIINKLKLFFGGKQIVVVLNQLIKK